MGVLMRAFDWSQTSVGAPASWPQSLRTALSLLLESKFPMLLCWGADYIQFYNDPFRPILGATKHPAFGKSTRETFVEAWHIIGPLFEQVMQGTAVGFDDMLVPLDRANFLEECYFGYSYSPIRDESGHVAGVFVTCTETTARVIAERRLRVLRDLASQAAQAHQEEEAWHKAAEVLDTYDADLTFSLLYALDADGRAARLVRQREELSRFAPPVIAADDTAPAWPLFTPQAPAGLQVVTDLVSRFGRYVGSAWPEPVNQSAVLPVTRPGLAQPYGFLVAGISPRLALDHRYRDFLVLVADQMATTLANARAYEEERRRTEALVELDRQKTAFFSNVSHEFRTPLTLLLGPLEEALSRSPASLPESEIALVHRNAVRLLRLVNTLLDFSRIEAGRAEITFQDADLAKVTRDVASGFTSLMGQAGLAYEIDCPPLPSTVSVDVAMWEKVVLNLLSNAFKFTMHGSVRVQLRDLDGELELRVSDTGAGIPAADLPHVFDRFHRVAGTPSRTFEGSGIGLALVRELVRMHDGDVRVESAEGRGSTFIVTIPNRIGQAAAKPLAIAAASVATPYLEEAGRWIGQRSTVAPPSRNIEQDPSMPTRVLVVDDNVDMRAYLQRLLEKSWVVDTAANGREAMERISTARPDLIVTDVMMPELDGVGLLHAIRQTAAIRSIPVLMLSARSGEESLLEGLAAGADDYIAKPFSARELVARVSTLLEVSRLRRELAAQNERLRTLIDVTPAAIAVVRGPAHVYELVNDRYRHVVGGRDIIGKPGREALPELVDQGLWDLCDHAYVTGEPYVGNEVRFSLDRLGTGTLDEAFFNFVLQPLENVRGDVEGLLIHAVEVTGQVLARRAIDDARKAAESANRTKDEFLAMLGHELRNPLAPILTALQLMTLRGDTGAERERAVIDRQVRHVVRLVDDLLDVARIARGKIELQRQRVELASVVAKAIEMTSSVIEERRHVLTIDVVPTGLEIDGDPTRLQQIVFNLLNNAAKYTEPRGSIAVTAQRRDAWIELRVRDTGIGIEPAMLPHVFDLFMQDRQALDRSQGGLGLGLAIVRNLTELHGGQVSVTSGGRGLGSEFMVTLPAAERAETASAPAPAMRRHSEAVEDLRVLVVDDNADAASFLAEALTLAGFDVRTAEDGAAALQIAESFAPQVALLDLGLPVMDGYELAERLQQISPRPFLIALTGYGSPAHKQRSEAVGFDMHVVKPVDVHDLIARMRGLATAER
jgi:signal transduction histidine kinase/DNA-binding response OmpR family regulator